MVPPGSAPRRRRVKDIACVLLVFVACSSGPSSALLDDEKQPTFLTASVGESVVFNCQVEFPHDIAIPYILRWNKEGNTVFSWYDGVMTSSEGYAGRVSRVAWDHQLQQYYTGVNHQAYGKGAVNLTSIRESDQGWYECRIYFPNRTPNTGRNGTWFHLTVDGGTLLAIPPINQTTMEGESAHFKCVTKEEGATVTWYKDGVQFSELPSLSSRSRISSDGSLTISPTDMGDPGYYNCEVTNEMGEKQSAGAHLNVEYKAKVIYSPSEQHLPHGRPGLLDCHFRANPPLTYLRWEKDGFLFDPYNVQGVFLMHNGSLYFNKVDSSHGGMYTCIPYNELGTEGPSLPMRVLITRPPVFTIKPNNLYVRKIGETISMPCDARHDVDESALTADAELGVPPPLSGKPVLSWTRKDGALIPHARSSISGGNLTIVNIQKEDRGFYQCVASNEASTITAEAELMIENVAPRAPYNLTANSTLTTISLRWVPGYRKPKQEYSVWYRREDSSEWKTLKILSVGTREAVVPNLNPGTTYDIMVLSQDVHGDGMFSKAIRVRTKGISPYSANTSKRVLNDLSGPFGFSEVMGPPKNVTVTVHSEGYLVSWEPPEPNTIDVQETPAQLVYTLRWAQGSQEHVIGKAETADTSFLVKGLEEDQTYHFQVVAIGPGDALSASSRFVLHVPPYRRMKAIMVGVLVGVSFLLLAAVASYFGRRAFLRHQKNSDRKSRQGHGGCTIGIPPAMKKTAEPLYMIKQPTVSTTMTPFECNDDLGGSIWSCYSDGHM
ncbi:protein borderless isoform X3 [Hetaerina americana]|uniref:protein borderless isoform X3 n=1 Tax=Hetaerina americana TaxID=62018 RepID=UPI003A7F5BC7